MAIGMGICLGIFSAYADDAASAGRMVCDENCKLGSAEPAGSGKAAKPAAKAPGFSVVSPVGRSAVKPISQVPRLKTLSGKTIAVVGTNFMARITHPEIKRLILKHYPDAKVILHEDIGGAGVYPPPGAYRRAKEEFQRKLKAMKVDAVISGNGGCGLCTPKETGSCIAAEYAGVPSVIIAGPGFVDQARYTALNSGVAVLRVAKYPGAFALHTEAELIRNTREVLWPQIVAGLTKPITPEEKAAGEKGSKGDIRDDVFYGTFDEVQSFFKEMNWTDGLPVVPPTFEKVNGFLKYTPYKWNDTIAVLPPAHRDVKAWHVAVNAVMAGCKPEYMPVLIAMTKGLGVHKFHWTLSSTHAWLPFCWLNGPVARQLGVDCGQGQMNAEANTAIGRFLNLAMINLCGYYIKQNRMGTFGYPMAWCLAEDDAACVRIGWAPFHMRNGYNLNDSTITMASALLWGNNMTPASTNAQKLTELIAWDITERGQFALGSGKQFVERTVLMTEPVAAILAKKYKTVDELEAALVKLARRPVRERVYAKYYAAPGSAKENSEHNIQQYSGYIRRTEKPEKTPTAPWRDYPDDEQLTIPVMAPAMTAFLITGDAARNKIQTMPGGGTATAKIELPANWDELMKAAGYKPLAEFRLTSDLKPSPPRESRYDRAALNREQYRRQQNGDRQNGSYNRQNRSGQNGQGHSRQQYRRRQNSSYDRQGRGNGQRQRTRSSDNQRQAED